MGCGIQKTLSRIRRSIHFLHVCHQGYSLPSNRSGPRPVPGTRSGPMEIFMIGIVLTATSCHEAVPSPQGAVTSVRQSILSATRSGPFPGLHSWVMLRAIGSGSEARQSILLRRAGAPIGAVSRKSNRDFTRATKLAAGMSICRGTQCRGPKGAMLIRMCDWRSAVLRKWDEEALVDQAPKVHRCTEGNCSIPQKNANFDVAIHRGLGQVRGGHE